MLVGQEVRVVCWWDRWLELGQMVRVVWWWNKEGKVDQIRASTCPPEP